MSNDNKEKREPDEINNPSSKKSIAFVDVDLLRSIDRLLRKRSHFSFVQIFFVYYTTDNQYYVILCLKQNEQIQIVYQ